MATVFLGLGSNVEPHQNLRLAISELQRRYGALEISNVYENAAVGFEGPDFLNLVVRLNSDESPADMHSQIESIHDLAGRERGEEKFIARPLDIDLLLYDDLVLDEPPITLPRGDILEYSFVLWPLQELAPELVHPVTGLSMTEHWQQFDQKNHPLLLSDLVLTSR
jgi:2-amino-4-hydroxy-6-hydroxymethyldihydropteridine diphosphokinase